MRDREGTLSRVGTQAATAIRVAIRIGATVIGGLTVGTSAKMTRNVERV